MELKIQIDFHSIGNKLRNARYNKHLTQEKVAEQMKMSPSSYSNIENGKQRPKLTNLLTICVLLDISPGEVLNDCCPELRKRMPTSDESSEKRFRAINLLSNCSDAQLDFVEKMIEALHNLQE